MNPLAAVFRAGELGPLVLALVRASRELVHYQAFIMGKSEEVRRAASPSLPACTYLSIRHLSKSFRVCIKGSRPWVVIECDASRTASQNPIPGPPHSLSARQGRSDPGVPHFAMAFTEGHIGIGFHGGRRFIWLGWPTNHTPWKRSASSSACAARGGDRPGEMVTLVCAMLSVVQGRTATEGAFWSTALAATLSRWGKQTQFDLALASSSALDPLPADRRFGRSSGCGRSDRCGQPEVVRLCRG